MFTLLTVPSFVARVKEFKFRMTKAFRGHRPIWDIIKIREMVKKLMHSLPYREPRRFMPGRIKSCVLITAAGPGRSWEAWAHRGHASSSTPQMTNYFF